MKKTALAITALFLLVTTATAGQYPVVGVVDGDTIETLYQGKKEQARPGFPWSARGDQGRG